MARKIDLSALQDSVGVMLAENSELTTLLGDKNGRIQGAGSASVAFPYVSIGANDVIDTGVQGLSARRVRFQCHIWTDERGFHTNKKIEAVITALLDDNEFEVTDHRIVSCFHERSEFMRDPEDGVRHGIVEFDIEIEAASLFAGLVSVNEPASAIGAALANIFLHARVNAPANATGAVVSDVDGDLSVEAPAEAVGLALAPVQVLVPLAGVVTGTGASEFSPGVGFSLEAPATAVGLALDNVETAGAIMVEAAVTAVGAALGNVTLADQVGVEAAAVGVASSAAGVNVAVFAEGVTTSVAQAVANLIVNVFVDGVSTSSGVSSSGVGVHAFVSGEATSAGASAAGIRTAIRVTGTSTAASAVLANVGVASGSSYTYTNTEASALVAEMTTEPDDTRKGVIDDFFTRAKLQGTWSEMDAFWVMAANDSQAAKLDWVAPDTGPALTEVGTPLFEEDIGYSATASATDALNTNWDRDTDGVNYTKDDASFGFWSLDEIGLGDGMGHADDARLRGTDYRINRAGNASGSDVFDAGFHVANRTGASDASRYLNGEEQNSTTGNSSQNLDAIDMYILTTNDSGTPGNTYGNPRMSAAFVGGGLTADQNWVLYEAIRRYLYDIGAFNNDFVDDYDRADSNLSDGANWTLQEGTATDFQIVSNMIERAKTSSSTIVTAPDTGSPDNYAEIYVDAPTWQNLGNAWPSLIARFSDVSNFVYIAIGNSGQGYALGKKVAGTNTTLGSYSPRTQGETLRLEVVGDNARLLVDGVEAIAWTSLGGDLSSGNLTGLANGNSDLGDWDNWKSGPIGGVEILTDDFDRADENVEDAAAWTPGDSAAASDWDIVSGQAVSSDTGGNAFIIHEFSGADYYIETEIDVDVAGSNNFIAGRYVDSNNFVGVRCRSTGYNLRKRVAGTYTSIASNALVPATGDIMRIEFKGDNARLIVNGAVVIDWTSLGGDLSAEGNPIFYRSSDDNLKINSFEVGTL